MEFSLNLILSVVIFLFCESTFFSCEFVRESFSTSHQCFCPNLYEGGLSKTSNVSCQGEWTNRHTLPPWKCISCSDWPCQRSGGWWSPDSSCWSVHVCWSAFGASAAWSGPLPRPPRAWWHTHRPGCTWCQGDSGVTRGIFYISINTGSETHQQEASVDFIFCYL